MKNIVHLIDNMKFMADIPDNHYDLAICDPPYGISVGSVKHYRTKLTEYKPKDWDTEPPPKEYFTELFRISKNQIIWGGNYFTKNLPPSKSWIVWDKKQPEGLTFSMHELAFCSIPKKQPKIFRHYPGGNRISNNEEKAKLYKKIHPTQKPVALYKWTLKNYAKPGWLILDTNVGSGSIRIACHDLGFDFEGCELDPDYWQAQEERYQNHISQQSLFNTEEIQDLIFEGKE